MDNHNNFRVICIDRNCVSAKIIFSKNSRKKERLQILYDLLKEVRKKVKK